MSHAYCKGEVWSYTDNDVNCYNGIPPEPQCQVDILDTSGSISSTDPQYRGCRVRIAVTDSLLTLTTTKFKVWIGLPLLLKNNWVIISASDFFVLNMSSLQSF